MRESMHIGSLEHSIRRNSSSGVSWGGCWWGGRTGSSTAETYKGPFLFLENFPL